MRRVLRALVVPGMLILLVVSGSPAWTAQKPQVEKVGTAVEAWYHVTPQPPQPAPLPLPTPEPVNPYAEKTLHVGITGGQEEARTYIDLDTEDLPIDRELAEGELILPVDPANGTLQAADARLQVCLAIIGPDKSVEGSFAPPPEVDCETKAGAIHVGKPFEHFVVDLSVFDMLELTTQTLAIVPTDKAREAADTWHVGFYGKKNDTEGAQRITAELILAPEVAPPPTDTDTDTTVPDTPDFDTGSFDPVIPDVPEIEDTETQEPATAPSPVAAAPEPVEELEAVRAASYTAVWTVPLVLLAFCIYFGSALTRDVVVRWDTKKEAG